MYGGKHTGKKQQLFSWADYCTRLAGAWPRFLESLADGRPLLFPSLTLSHRRHCFPFATQGCLSPPLKLSCQLDIPGACQHRRQQSGDGPNARGLPPLLHFSHSNHAEKQRETQPRQRPEATLGTQPPPATHTQQVSSRAASASAPAAFQGRMDRGGMNKGFVSERGWDVIREAPSMWLAGRAGSWGGGTAGTRRGWCEPLQHPWGLQNVSLVAFDSPSHSWHCWKARRGWAKRQMVFGGVKG